MDSRSEDGAEYDRGSVCSTAATGLSTLSARIASLTADFGDRLRPGIAEGHEFGPYPAEGDEEEEEEVVELTEEQVLQELDKQEPAFQVTQAIDVCRKTEGGHGTFFTTVFIAHCLNFAAEAISPAAAVATTSCVSLRKLQRNEYHDLYLIAGLLSTFPTSNCRTLYV